MFTVFLSTAYLGPVQYYCKMCSYDRVMVEANEHYVKQTYRNRCIIVTANGLHALSVPVENPRADKCLIKDIRISDHGNWQHIHWNALVSAYGMSPYFEYYRDDFEPFYQRTYSFLFDWNEQLCATVCELLDIQPSVSFTDEYLADVPNDFRETIRPRRPDIDPLFHPQPYYQVFGEKYGFLANVSIVDLLFNMGPEGVTVLQASTKR